MKYGYEILPEWFEVPKFAFLLKKDLAEKNPFDELEIKKGDVVMECGCFIGTFASACIENGAATVISFEAEPRNFEFVSRNLTKYGKRFKVFNNAIVGKFVPFVTIYSGGFRGCDSIINGNQGKTITRKSCVRAASFRGELLKIKPSVLKMDIEGAEYEALKTLKNGDLKSIREMHIEFHKNPQRDIEMKAFEIFLNSQGFEKTIKSRPRKFVAKRIKNI